MLSALLGITQPIIGGGYWLRSLAIYAFALGSMASGAMAGLWETPLVANAVGAMGIILVVTLALFTPKPQRL